MGFEELEGLSGWNAHNAISRPQTVPTGRNSQPWSGVKSATSTHLNSHVAPKSPTLAKYSDAAWLHVSQEAKLISQASSLSKPIQNAVRLCRKVSESGPHERMQTLAFGITTQRSRDGTFVPPGVKIVRPTTAVHVRSPTEADLDAEEREQNQRPQTAFELGRRGQKSKAVSAVSLLPPQTHKNEKKGVRTGA